MKILFTGASSFTGFWFVKALAAAGHEIVCPITNDLMGYVGTRGRRIEMLKPVCRFVACTPFGSDNFLKLVRAENFDQLCHHAATVTNYKSADFDVQVALRNNTHNLPAVLAILCERGLKAVVLTGTYFEANEGAGSEPRRTFSPYSVSKTLIFDAFLAECHAAGLSLGKFVMPNPFGPLEEPRFTAFLMNTWKTGMSAEVMTPDYVRDNIHVDLLAKAYVKFTGQSAVANNPVLKINPSGYAETQAEFAQRVAREVRTRTGWDCGLKFATQSVFSEPLRRVNTEPAIKYVSDWSESIAWDAFTKFYID